MVKGFIAFKEIGLNHTRPRVDNGIDYWFIVSFGLLVYFSMHHLPSQCLDNLVIWSKMMCYR